MFLNTLEDATGLSSALLKPCLSKRHGFLVYLYPTGDPQSRCNHMSPSLSLNLTQELKLSGLHTSAEMSSIIFSWLPT